MSVTHDGRPRRVGDLLATGARAVGVRIQSLVRMAERPGCYAMARPGDVRHCRSMLLLMPTYRRDFNATVTLLGSVLSLGTDLHSISARIVVSSDAEEQTLLEFLATAVLPPRQCTGSDSPGLDLGITTLPRTMEHVGEGCDGLSNTTAMKELAAGRKTELSSWQETCAHLGWVSGHIHFPGRATYSQARFGQFYQSVKKLYAARYFDYRVMLLLDSDSTLVQPTSFNELYARFQAAPVVFTQKAGGMRTDHCMSVLLNASDGEVLVSQKPPKGWLLTAYGKALAQSPPPLLQAFAPYTFPWGTLSWFWEKSTVDRLFEHVQERHGVRLAERLNAVIMVSTEGIDSGGRGVWTPFRCYEAALYWYFALLLEAERGDDNPRQNGCGVRKRSRQCIATAQPHPLNLSQLVWPEQAGGTRVQPQRLPYYFASPDVLMERYFPGLRNQSVRISTFERSLSTLFVANTTEPFNGWLKMCRDLNLSFFRLLRPVTLNMWRRAAKKTPNYIHPLQPSGTPRLLRWLPPEQRNDVLAMLSRAGDLWVPPNVPLYSTETYFAMVGCMIQLCPTLSVHANQNMESWHGELLSQVKLARDDPQRCELFSRGQLAHATYL